MRNILQDFKKLADNKYQKFTSGLLPGVNHILGVRIPKIRAYAKTFSFEDAQNYCKNYQTKHFEEYFLKAILLARICKQIPPKNAIKLINGFIPKISNWSVCDAFCADLKIIKKYPEVFLPLILKNLKSKREYAQRTALNLARAYYLQEPYFKQILKAILELKPTKYYSQMAQAWFMCEAYIKQQRLTKPALKHLTPEVYAMTKRKIKDSYRVR
ncbi:MAG: DNA alkylation repair protein [Elusimicrobiaceae bacterium]|nr:DNA alkylation repair protein [Elusimicrobiaceae bacterium]